MIQQQEMVREVVGIFDTHEAMEKAIENIQIAGFGRHQISILGTEAAMKEQFGKRHVDTEVLKDNPDAPRASNVKKEEMALAQGALIGGGMLTGFVATVIASGGLAIPGIVTAAAIGAGTAAGGIFAKILGNKYGDFFQQQIEQGGLLLWVNTPDAESETKAQELLKEYGARDVHVHELPIHDTEGSDSTYSSRSGVN